MALIKRLELRRLLKTSSSCLHLAMTIGEERPSRQEYRIFLKGKRAATMLRRFDFLYRLSFGAKDATALATDQHPACACTATTDVPERCTAELYGGDSSSFEL